MHQVLVEVVHAVLLRLRDQSSHRHTHETVRAQGHGEENAALREQRAATEPPRIAPMMPWAVEERDTPGRCCFRSPPDTTHPRSIRAEQAQAPHAANARHATPDGGRTRTRGGSPPAVARVSRHVRARCGPRLPCVLRVERLPLLQLLLVGVRHELLGLPKLCAQSEAIRAIVCV